MAVPRRRSLERALEHIFLTYRPELAHYAWEMEEERYKELLVCVLIAGLGIDPAEARGAVSMLSEMQVLKPSGPRADDRALIVNALQRRGYIEHVAKRLADTLISTSEEVTRRWEGHLQRFLREHGESMVGELSAILPHKLLSDESRRRVATLWLQNVANLPLLLPGDSHISGFCEQYGASSKDLERSADALGLNVAIVDDLLALHYEHGNLRSAPSRQKDKPPKRKKEH